MHPEFRTSNKGIRRFLRMVYCVIYFCKNIFYIFINGGIGDKLTSKPKK